MRDMVYIVGICVAVMLSFTVGTEHGFTKGVGSIPIPSPVEISVEKQCIAWFFDADLKAAKKHMGGKR